MLLLLLLGLVGAPPRGDVAALNQEAMHRYQTEDWCGALYYAEGMLALAETEKVLLNAARAASNGGDLARALVLYERVSQFAPTFKADDVKKEVAEVRERIAHGEPGTSCPVPPATCGNALIEAAEACDDGNVVDDASCLATCVLPAPIAAVAIPPPDGENTVPLVLGVGGAVVGGLGAVLGIVGVLPALSYLGGVPQQATLSRRYQDATSAQARTNAGVDIVQQHAALEESARDWNQQGQWLLWTGIAAVGVGAAGGVAGVVLSHNSEEPDSQPPGRGAP